MIEESDKDLAVKTLREICVNNDAPANAKATAARTLLELSGDIGKLQISRPSDDKALHELSRAELDAEIARVAKPNGARQPEGTSARTSNNINDLTSAHGLADPQRTFDASQCLDVALQSGRRGRPKGVLSKSKYKKSKRVSSKRSASKALDNAPTKYDF